MLTRPLGIQAREGGVIVKQDLGGQVEGEDKRINGWKL